jgi:probable phosphoglycerate mutase
VLDCLYRAASRIALDAPRSWQLGNASINRLLYTPQGFTLVGWSDAHHLEDAPLDEAADGATTLRARRA